MRVEMPRVDVLNAILLRPLCPWIPECVNWIIREFQAECGSLRGNSHELSSAVAMSPSSGGAHVAEGCIERFLPQGPQRFPQAVDFVTYNNHEILADLPMAEFFEPLESVL